MKDIVQKKMKYLVHKSERMMYAHVGNAAKKTRKLHKRKKTIRTNDHKFTIQVPQETQLDILGVNLFRYTYSLANKGPWMPQRRQ